MSEIRVPVPEEFRTNAEAAVVRLSYLHPQVAFRYDEDTHRIEAVCSHDTLEGFELEKEIRFQLYREKIHAETLPIRRRLYGDG